MSYIQKHTHIYTTHHTHAQHMHKSIRTIDTSIYFQHPLLAAPLCHRELALVALDQTTLVIELPLLSTKLLWSSRARCRCCTMAEEEWWSDLAWTELLDRTSYKKLVEDEAKQNMVPLFSCRCMNNVKDHTDGKAEYSCKANLKSLGTFGAFSRAEHRVLIHAKTCPKHLLTENEAQELLDALPESISIAFVDKDQLQQWESEQEKLKKEKKKKEKRQKQNREREWEKQEREKQEREERETDRRGHKRDRDRDRDRDEEEHPARRKQGSRRPPEPEVGPSRRLTSSAASASMSSRPKSAAVGREMDSPPREERSRSPVRALYQADTEQMAMLSIPGVNSRSSPKNILLEWLSKAEASLKNAEKLARFVANAFAEEAQIVHSASPACFGTCQSFGTKTPM